MPEIQACGPQSEQVPSPGGVLRAGTDWQRLSLPRDREVKRSAAPRARHEQFLWKNREETSRGSSRQPRANTDNRQRQRVAWPRWERGILRQSLPGISF